MTNLYQSRWFQVFRPVATPALRLFCFPYAGGNAKLFAAWHERLPREVEVVAVQYPGRGMRFAEQPIACCTQMVNELLAQIRQFTNMPFALFGHSNGGLISFELARALQEAGNTQQRHHFLSAALPAHLAKESTLLHNLPDGEFRRRLAELGGTPPELLADRELMDLLLPVLRADFSLSETYCHRRGAALRVGATLLHGREDRGISQEVILRWGELIDGPVGLECYPGGHFFINTQRDAVLTFLNGKLRDLLDDSGITRRRA